MARDGKARVLNTDELKRLYSVIKSNKHSNRNICILDFSFMLGMRVSEICSLKLGDVTSMDEILKDGFTINGKGNKNRSIFLSNPKVRKHLISYLEDRKGDNLSLPLFKSQKSGFSPNSMGALMKRLYKKSGLDGCKSHSGRRNFATTLLQHKGVSIKNLQVLMGHSNISTTSIYVEHNDIELSNIVKGL